MQCIICHGEDIVHTTVQEELKIENDIVYIPIHILQCRTCGERYYDRRTMRYLEEVAQKLRKGEVPLQEIGRVLVYS